MWPDDYIEWARQAHSVITRMIENALAQKYLARNPRLNVDTPEIVREIIRYTFDMATSRRVHGGYFDGVTQFQWWLASVAFKHLRDQLIERPEYAERVQSLNSELLQPFGWVILDRIEISEAARQLGLSPAEVERRVSVAFRHILE
jgi:hypothetical protein